jgi:tetratricopeptide (TPR) repeat protein
MRSALQANGDFAGANEARQFLNLTVLADDPLQAVAAAPQIEAVLKSEPDYVPALMALARISEQKNDVNATKQTYEKILGLYPDFAPAQKRLAILCAENADNDPQAYGFATKARAAFPDDPEVAKSLGIIFYLQGDYARAERLLKESVITRNTDPEIFYYLGMAQYHLKKTAECKNNLRQAENLNLPAKFTQETKRILVELK